MKTTIGVALIIIGLLGLFPPMTNASNRGFLFSEKSHDGHINTGKLLGEVLVVGFITGLVVFICHRAPKSDQLGAVENRPF